MREIIINWRVAIVDNILYLLQFLDDELTAFKDIYLNVNVIFSRVCCGVRLAIVKQGVELQLYSLYNLFDDVWLVFILEEDFSTLFVELSKCSVKLINAKRKLKVHR